MPGQPTSPLQEGAPMENDPEDAPNIVDRRAASRMSDAPQPESGQPDPADAGPPSDERVDAAEERAETSFRNWQRTAADFANFKRRVEHERSEASRLINAAVVINLLPVYDDLDRAVATVDANLAGLNWVQGVVAIQRKFALLLEAMNVKELPAAGQPFDPNLHEAVARQPGEEGRVLHVVQKGYALGDKVIRPAMVIVGEGQPAQQ